MTLDQALRLRKGDKVTHRAAFDARDRSLVPLRVTEVWVNSKRSIVLIRIASICTGWLDATGYEAA